MLKFTLVHEGDVVGVNHPDGTSFYIPMNGKLCEVSFEKAQDYLDNFERRQGESVRDRITNEPKIDFTYEEPPKIADDDRVKIRWEIEKDRLNVHQSTADAVRKIYEESRREDDWDDETDDSDGVEKGDKRGPWLYLTLLLLLIGFAIAASQLDWIPTWLTMGG